MNAGLINGSGVVIQEVLAEIGRRKMRPNTVTYNTLLSGYLRFDQLDSMKAFVEQMKNERVEFSSVTQATILQAVELARSVGDIDKFMELSVARIVPSQVQGSQAVQDLIGAGRVVLAQELCVC